MPPNNGDGDPPAEDEAAAGEDGSSSDGEETEQFDISLAAAHTYMGSGLVQVSGRSVLEAGWVGRLAVLAHAGAVFPGETVPMLLPHSHDAQAITQAIQKYDKLFGLLCPDETGTLVSGYGVVCEVFEASGGGGVGGAVVGGGGGGGGAESSTLTIKARAIHRFRLLDTPAVAQPIHVFARARVVRVRVLPEVSLGDPLRPAGLGSLDGLRRGGRSVEQMARKMDALGTPWPLFVYAMFDYRRMRDVIRDYFSTLMLDKLPDEPVSLSFWVASNLALSGRDRLALFTLDNALHRLHMEVRFIMRKSVLCCSSCMTEIARREHIFAMSTDGVHSNYTNLGGYMHDIVTVTRVTNTELSGAPSAEYCWFPGYSWTIALCASCIQHIGWRFKALKKNLRPQQFYGICRNYVQPRADDDSSPSSPPPAPAPAPAAAARRARIDFSL